MKVTILGTGSPEGGKILFSKTKQHLERLRPGLLIEYKGHNILFDANPDIRQQLLHLNIQNISSIFLTHYHFDHIWGIGDLDQLHWVKLDNFKIYANLDTISYLKQNISWLSKFPKPILPSHQFDDLEVIPIEINHSSYLEMTGYIIKTKSIKIGYVPDIKKIPEKSLKLLQNCDILVADGQYILGKYIEDHDHAGGEELLQILNSCNAKKYYLIAYSEYWYKTSADEAEKKLPNNFDIPDDYEVIYCE